ncbi:MAG TPA: iron-sulfur cluster assembly accessory protein [Thermodesulfovibrionales bacterium]|nr:iron-sulfur cluster assembly accessory protein [Thermodesulfovibrionales bacterium]
MLKISDVAAEKAKEILAAEGKDSWGLRIYTAEGGCCGPSYGMDLDERSSDGDEVVEKNGLRVFMDQNTSRNLEGMEIDFVDDGERQGFVITGGAAPSCGSGCSSCG